MERSPQLAFENDNDLPAVEEVPQDEPGVVRVSISSMCKHL